MAGNGASVPQAHARIVTRPLINSHFKLATNMPEGVFSIGRAGAYLYNVDIDDTIDHAMKVAEALRA